MDGFVVPREPKYYDKHSNRAKYVAKAICSFGNCRPVKRSQEVEVELITGYSLRFFTSLCYIHLYIPIMYHIIYVYYFQRAKTTFTYLFYHLVPILRATCLNTSQARNIIRLEGR